MKLNIASTVFLSLIASFAAAEVVDLTDDNFDELVGSKPALVKVWPLFFKKNF